MALGAAQCHRAAVADWVVHIQPTGKRSAGNDEYRHAARQLPARSGADVVNRPADLRDSGTGAFPGVLHPGRLESLESPDDEPGPSLHVEFPLDGDQWTGRRLQPGDAIARVSR